MKPSQNADLSPSPAEDIPGAIVRREIRPPQTAPAGWKRAALLESCLAESPELLGWTPPVYVVVHVRRQQSTDPQS